MNYTITKEGLEALMGSEKKMKAFIVRHSVYANPELPQQGYFHPQPTYSGFTGYSAVPYPVPHQVPMAVPTQAPYQIPQAKPYQVPHPYWGEETYGGIKDELAKEPTEKGGEETYLGVEKTGEETYGGTNVKKK